MLAYFYLFIYVFIVELLAFFHSVLTLLVIGQCFIQTKWFGIDWAFPNWFLNVVHDWIKYFIYFVSPLFTSNKTSSGADYQAKYAVSCQLEQLNNKLCKT